MTICMITRAVRRRSPKEREREIEPADIFELFRILRVVEGAGYRAVCEPAARTLLSIFGVIDRHFTYTLCPDHAATEVIVADDDAEVNENENDHSGQVGDKPVDESVSMFDVSRFFLQKCNCTRPLHCRGHNSVNIWN